ncbi:hypothetical protein LUZ60_003547 [Juncus effusus]|nr:hypothetical protein LUZ60_003547 [Juncus effusus]
MTPYHELCKHKLAPFIHSVSPDNLTGWARVAVSVAISETERISNHLLSKMNHTSPPFIDCIECMFDAAVQLRSSLKELKKLDNTEFSLQMNDVETWLSAALTDAITCVDELEGFKGVEIGDVKHKVLKAAYLCSNALALVNKLASSGNNIK